jgi:2-hydroxy-3-keto-5-methylthiopentenyl-1-phosphate phosphatase
VFKKGNTLQNLLYKRNNKNLLDKSHVVYKLSCKNCSYVYIGQTSKKLSTRLNQHDSAIRNNHPNQSNVAKHAINFNHHIDFESPIIAHVENNFRARLTLEALEIEKHKLKNINLMNDKQNSNTYIPRQYLALYSN